MNHSTEPRDPRKLSVHPAARHQPEWADDDSRFEHLIESIRDQGIVCPVVVDPEDRIVDGRHRWRAAKRLQIPSVPVQVCDRDEVSSIILSTLIQRRHYTPGQIAYLAFPAFEGAYEEACRRRLAALKKNTNGLKPAKTVQDLAAEIGVSRDLFLDAAKLHEKFAKNPDLRAQFEPRILDQHDPIGLGAAVAGIGGQGATKGKDRPQPRQLELFVAAWDTIKTRLATWEKLDADSREQVVPAIRETVAAMPDDLRKQLRAEIDRAERASK